MRTGGAGSSDASGRLSLRPAAAWRIDVLQVVPPASDEETAPTTRDEE